MLSELLRFGLALIVRPLLEHGLFGDLLDPHVFDLKPKALTEEL